MSDLRFSLEVIKAENLVKKNFFTSPNVIVKIVDLSQPDVCYTSEQAPKSSNAKWNETFNLHLHPTDGAVQLSIWDERKFHIEKLNLIGKSKMKKSKNSGFMGQVTLNSISIQNFMDKGEFLIPLEKLPDEECPSVSGYVILKLNKINEVVRRASTDSTESSENMRGSQSKIKRSSSVLSTISSAALSALSQLDLRKPSKVSSTGSYTRTDSREFDSDYNTCSTINSIRISRESLNRTPDLKLDELKSIQTLDSSVSKNTSTEHLADNSATVHSIEQRKSILPTFTITYIDEGDTSPKNTPNESNQIIEAVPEESEQAQASNTASSTLTTSLLSPAGATACSPSASKERTLRSSLLKMTSSISSGVSDSLSRSNSSLSTPSFLQVPSMRRRSSNMSAKSAGSTTSDSLHINNLLSSSASSSSSIERELIRKSSENISRILKSEHLMDLALKYKEFKHQILNYGTRVLILKLELSRKTVLEDSYCFLSKLNAKYARTHFLIKFKDEEGVDYGGVGKEWFHILSGEIFKPAYGLFENNKQDNRLEINRHSTFILPDYESLYHLVGQMFGLALYNGFHVDVSFSQIIFKHILNEELELEDLKLVDYSLFNSLNWILNNNVDEGDLDLTFSVSYIYMDETFSVNLKENGSNIDVTEANKQEFVKLYKDWRLKTSIKKQLDAFLKGFSEIVPFELVKIFNSSDLQLLICGLDIIDIPTWKENTVYKNCSVNTSQVRWFWKAVESFDNDRRVKLMQLVTGSTRLPLKEFVENDLNEPSGQSSSTKPFTICFNKMASPISLPVIKTCFNRITLPKYDNYEILRQKLRLTIDETQEFSVQ